LGIGAASSGVAGAGRTSGPLTGGLRGGRPCAGAEADNAERFGVDLEFTEDATRVLDPGVLVALGGSSFVAGDLVPPVWDPEPTFFLSPGADGPGGMNCMSAHAASQTTMTYR
jgi:hypothetical protein